MSAGAFKKLLFTTTLLTAALFSVTPAFAQYGDSSSVEVNLDVLENIPTTNYDAPIALTPPTPSYNTTINNAIESTPLAAPNGFENPNDAPVIISSQTTAPMAPAPAPSVAAPVIQLTPPSAYNAPTPVTAAPVRSVPVAPQIVMPPSQPAVMAAPAPVYSSAPSYASPVSAAPTVTPPIMQQQTVTQTTTTRTQPQPSFLDVIENSVNRLAGAPTAPSPQPAFTQPLMPMPTAIPQATQQLQIMPPVAMPAAPVIQPQIQPSPQLAVQTPPTVMAVAPAPIPVPTVTAPVTPPAPVTTVAPTQTQVQNPILAEPIRNVPTVAVPPAPAMQVAEPQIKSEDIDWRKDIKVTPASSPATVMAEVETPAPQEIEIDVVKPSPLESEVETIAFDDDSVTIETAKSAEKIDWRQAVSVTPTTQTPPAAKAKPAENQNIIQNASIGLPAGETSEPIGRDDQPIQLAVPQTQPMDTAINVETLSISNLDKQPETFDTTVQTTELQPIETTKRTRIVKLKPEDMEADKPLAEILAETKSAEDDNVKTVITQPAASELKAVEKVKIVTNDVDTLRNVPTETEIEQITVKPEPIKTVETVETVETIETVETVEKKQPVVHKILDEPVEPFESNISIAQFNSETSMPIARVPEKIDIAVVDNATPPETAPEGAMRGYQNMDTEVAIVKSMGGAYDYNKNSIADKKIENITVDDLKTVEELSSPLSLNARPPEISVEVPNGRAPAPAFDTDTVVIAEPELAIETIETAEMVESVKISKDSEPEVASSTKIETTETIAVKAAPVEAVEAEPVEAILAETESVPDIQTAFFMPNLDDMSLIYNGAESTLTDDLKSQLTPVVGQLNEDKNVRLQLRSYAAPTDGSASSARRIALARAIELRKYMLDQGIPATRIDVRALGDQTDKTPANRIDMVIVE